MKRAHKRTHQRGLKSQTLKVEGCL